MELLLFGDQTTNYLATLRSLLQLDRTPYLSTFLEAATTLIKLEIAALPKHVTLRLPTFSIIEELVDQYNYGTERNAVLDSCLISVAQLVHFIKYVEFLPRISSLT